MSWMERVFNKNSLITHKSNIPDGIWTKCDSCNYILYHSELKRNLQVCPKCDHHMYISARNRLFSFLDPGSEYELGKDLEPKDILKFKDLKKYQDRLTEAQQITGEKDALIVMKGKIYQIPVVTASFEFAFIGGSISSVVGSRFLCAVQQALSDQCPFICFSASGGARMQESLISLMQMAKISAALMWLYEKKIPYISILTNPTMGGTSASLAMLGDINIAEPKALIGFAGPRVIEQTVHEKLPVGFQRSEFLLEKGIIDLIVHRTAMRWRVANLLAKLTHRVSL